MTAKENRELKSSVFVDLFYEDESAEENDISFCDRYKKKTIKIPKPEFYTFYNGKEKLDKEYQEKLMEEYGL